MPCIGIGIGGIWNPPGPGIGGPPLGIMGGGMKGRPPGSPPEGRGGIPPGINGGGFCPIKGGMFGFGGMDTPPIGKTGIGSPPRGGGIMCGTPIGMPIGMPPPGVGIGGFPGTNDCGLGRGAPPTLLKTSRVSRVDGRREPITKKK